jgi:hypothetical protein
MIRLFGDAPRQPTDSYHVDFKALAVNTAGAMACALLAFVYFAVAFAAGESRQPMPASAFVVLWIIALTVAVFGAVLAAITKHFPWLVAVLTPLFLAGLFRSLGERDAFVSDLELGGIASGLFLIGALAARAMKYWIRNSRQANPLGTAVF